MAARAVAASSTTGRRESVGIAIPAGEGMRGAPVKGEGGGLLCYMGVGCDPGTIGKLK